MEEILTARVDITVFEFFSSYYELYCKTKQNSVLSGSLSVTKYRVTFSKNDKFGQKITENANNVKFVTKKRQLQ